MAQGAFLDFRDHGAGVGVDRSTGGILAMNKGGKTDFGLVKLPESSISSAILLLRAARMAAAAVGGDLWQLAQAVQAHAVG